MSSVDSYTGIVIVDSRNNSGSITLPAASTVQGRSIIFKDGFNSFGTHPLNLSTSGVDIFENNSNLFSINETGGFINVVAGSNIWYSINGSYVNTQLVSSITVSSINGNFYTDANDLGSLGYLSSVTNSFTELYTEDLNASTVNTSIVDFISSVGETTVITLSKVNKIITGYDNLLYAVGSGNGLATIKTSVDGINWINAYEQSQLETANDIVTVNSSLMIVTGIGDGTSAVPTVYTKRSYSLYSNEWLGQGVGLVEGKSIAYNKDKYIVVGKTDDNYSTLVISSDAGITWTPSNIGYSQLNGITYTERAAVSSYTNFGLYPLYNSDPNTLFISTLSSISSLVSDLLPSTINVIKTFSNISSPNFTNVNITLLGGEGNNSLVMSLDNCLTFSSLGGHTFSTVNAIAFSTNFWAVAGYTDGTSNGTVQTTYNLSEWTTALTPLTIASDIIYNNEVVDPAYPVLDMWLAVGYTDGTSNGTLQVSYDGTLWLEDPLEYNNTDLTWARSVSYSISTGVYAMVGDTDGTTSNTLQLCGVLPGQAAGSWTGINNCLTTGHKIRYASNINRFIAVGEGPLFSAMVIYPRPATDPGEGVSTWTYPNLWRGQITPFTSAKDVTSFCSSNDEDFQYFITGESASSNTSVVTAKLPIQQTSLFNETSFEWIPQPSALQNGTAIAYDSNTSNLYVGGSILSTFNIPYWIAVGNTLPYVDSYNNPLYSPVQVYSSFSSLKDNVQVPLDTYVNTETLSTNLVSITDVTVLKQLSNIFIAGYGIATDDNIGPHILRTSLDGRTWGSSITLDTEDKLTVISAIEYSGSLWMVGGTADGAGTNALQTSADLETWTSQTTGLLFINTILYGDNLWLAGGTNGGELGPLKTSSAGITWNDTPIDINTIIDIKYGNNVYIACGSSVIDGALIGKILTSPDGIDWTAATLDDTIITVYKISYNGSNRWAAIASETDGTSGGTILISSNDGQTWVKRANIPYTFNATYNLIFRNTSWGGEWLVHASSSPYDKSLYKSENNGDTWISVDTHFSNVFAMCPTSQSINADFLMLGTAVNNSSNIFVSNDGETWNASYVPEQDIKVVHTVNTPGLIDMCILGTSTGSIYYTSLSTFGNNFSTYGLNFAMTTGKPENMENINSIHTFKEGNTDYIAITAEGLEQAGLNGAYVTTNLTEYTGIITQDEGDPNLVHTIAYNSNTNRYIAGGYNSSRQILESFTSNISYAGPWNYNTLRTTSNDLYVFDDNLYINDVLQPKTFSTISSFKTSYLELYNSNPVPYPYVSTSLQDANIVIRDFSYLYAGGTNGIVRSSDGINWSSVYTSLDCKAAATNFSSVTAFVGTDGDGVPTVVSVTSNTIWRSNPIPHIIQPYTIKYDRYAHHYDDTSQSFAGINYWLIGGSRIDSNSCSLVISEDLISFGGISTSLCNCYDIHLIGDTEYNVKTNSTYLRGGQWLICGEGGGSNAEGEYFNLQRTSNYGNTWTGIPAYMTPIKTITSRPTNTNDLYDAKYIIGGTLDGTTSNSTMQITSGALDGFQPVSTIFKEVYYVECVSTFFVASGLSEDGIISIQVSEDGIYWSSVSSLFNNFKGIIYNDPPQNNNYTAVGTPYSLPAGYGVIQHISSPYNWGYTTSPLAYEDYKEQTSAVLQLIDNDIYINQNRYTDYIKSLQINTDILKSLNIYSLQNEIFTSYNVSTYTSSVTSVLIDTDRINSIDSYTGSTYTSQLYSIQFDATSISSQNSYTGLTYTTNLISLEINTDSISSQHSYTGSTYTTYVSSLQIDSGIMNSLHSYMGSIYYSYSIL
jgi:hypothetical protein